MFKFLITALALTVSTVLCSPLSSEDGFGGEFGSSGGSLEEHSQGHFATSYVSWKFGSPHKKLRTVVITKEEKYPVPKPYPVTVEKIVPYPVQVPVEVKLYKPVPVHVVKHYPVYVEKKVPYPVEKQVPYAVEVPVKVPVPVPKKIEIIKPVPVPISKPVPVPHPVYIEKIIPVYIKKHENSVEYDSSGGIQGGEGKY